MAEFPRQHPRRSGGTIFLKLDGNQIEVAGDFAYQLSTENLEVVDNLDGSIGINGVPTHGFISGSIRNYNHTNLGELRTYIGNVTLELANGKTVVAPNAVQTDAMEVNTTTGEVPIRFAAERVEEIK